MNILQSDIARLRPGSQQLYGTAIKTATDMVSWFGAVQGQEYAQTKWGLGLRLPHLNDPDIEKELSEGKILRTHLLRPTWHFVTSEDIRWLLMLTAPRVNAANSHMYRKLELDSAIFNKCNKVLTDLLQGGRQLTREEINDEFKKIKIEAKGLRLIYIMMRSELDGIICSGERKGNQFTYALLDERVKTSRKYSREEALAEIANRYFNSRGPATVKDFSTWSGLTIAECKQGLDANINYFDRIILGTKEYYFSSEHTNSKKPTSEIYMLPIYDEYIMGYKDRSDILQFKQKLNPDPPFSYYNMIIFDGQIIGTWKRTIGKKQIDLEVDFFTPLNKDQGKEFENSIRKFSLFNNKTVHVGKFT